MTLVDLTCDESTELLFRQDDLGVPFMVTEHGKYQADGADVAAWRSFQKGKG